MRMVWRTFAWVMLLAAWPQLGCLHLPGEQGVQSKSPKGDGRVLTAAEITQAWAQADSFQREGKTIEAVAVYEKIREAGGSSGAHATKKLAAVFDQNGELDRAEAEYKRLMQQNPKNADLMSKMGDLYARRANWEEARRWYGEALKHQAEHASARTGLAETLAHLSDYEASLTEFKKVVSPAEAYCTVAFYLEAQRKPQEAIQYYQRALIVEPTMQRARVELARIQQSMEISRQMEYTGVGRPVHTKLSSTRSRTGAVDLEETPNSINNDAGRQMMQRPSLPPLSSLPDFDLPNKK